MKHLMLFSTHTGVGKHTIACGILRSLKRQGIGVIPFKAVSIEKHTCMLPNGSEMSFAQVIQAMAAGKAPRPEMNPYVALYSENFSLIELGNRLTAPPHVIRDRQHYLDIIENAFASVHDQAQLVIIEGSASPVELGLENVDLANIPVSRMADARILLLTEMLHGGGYASILGTWHLLPEDVRGRVVGIILNKFDIEEPIEFARNGANRLSELINLPVSIIPFLHDTYIPSDITLYPTEYAKFANYDAEFDQLADLVEKNIDMNHLKQVLEIEE